MTVLSARDSAVLGGEFGPGAALAMRVLHRFAIVVGAEGLLDVVGAHVDGCLHHGQVGLDFVDRLVEGDGRVVVPTTLNVGSLDLIHPGLVHLPAAEAAAARRLMEQHVRLGCRASFTCAPYQERGRPGRGEHVAWGESNAIVFANSVLGARTARYGDFLDLCCAVTGRAPAWGLHLEANRRGTSLFRLHGFPASLRRDDALFVAVGLIVGAASGEGVPVIEGLPGPPDEDLLKALGAAAASTGSVGLFHAVGLTPEAATLAEAFGGRPPPRATPITPADAVAALRRLSAAPDGSPLSAVCLGTPHFSIAEWRRLLALLDGVGRLAAPIYVNTSRSVLAVLRSAPAFVAAREAGVIAVADTCTYVTPVLRNLGAGAVMTSSGKWAHYAPGNIGATVAFGSLEDCVASARAGRVERGGQAARWA